MGSTQARKVTCGWSRRPTATWRRRCARGASARTSTTASTSSASSAAAARAPRGRAAARAPFLSSAGPAARRSSRRTREASCSAHDVAGQRARAGERAGALAHPRRETGTSGRHLRAGAPRCREEARACARRTCWARASTWTPSSASCWRGAGAGGREQAAAAKLLGITRRRLYSRLQSLGEKVTDTDSD